MKRIIVFFSIIHQATSKNLSSKLRELETEYSKQQELLYNIDFQAEQVERKISRGLGERSDHEKEMLQARITQLENDHQLKTEKKKTLTQRCKHLEQELHRSQRKQEEYRTSQLKLQEIISEIELEISSCEIKVKQLISQMDEALVAQDIVRVEVRRLRDTLRKRSEEVFRLEESREELVEKMIQRKKEITVELEVKTAQLRAAEEERHKSAVELGQRSLVAEKMELKYEMLTKAHHPYGEGKDGDSKDAEHSHVYYLITAAQKRSDLQKEGDKLDADLRKKETELKAMEKTLLHLKKRNTEFRKSFAKVDSSSVEFQEVMDLEEQLRQSEKKLFEVEKEEHKLKQDNGRKRRRLDMIHQQISQLQKENENLTNLKEKEIKEYVTELQNAEHLERLLKEKG